MCFDFQRYNAATGKFFCLAVSVFISTFFLNGIDASAANNPLSTVTATQFSRQSGGVRMEAAIGGGENLSSIHDGDYVAYKGFDFDSGVAGFTARISTPNSGTIEVRLDSPSGVILGQCAFKSTGGWQSWQDVSCAVDNSQAGVRDIYLVFHGKGKRALVNVFSFRFLKTLIVSPGGNTPDLSARLDRVDEERQSTNSWGIPEQGFKDDFEETQPNHWSVTGMRATTRAIDKLRSLESPGTNLNFALTPDIYINKTDTGGDWRSLAEAALEADIVLDSQGARPGIGFSSKDGRQWIYAALNADDNSIEVWRKLTDGTATPIKAYTRSTNATWSIQPHVRYRLQIDWSPYSDGLIVFLQDGNGNKLADFRTVIDLPVARHPLLICSGGPARFDNVHFDPTIDGWNFKWQWKKSPILTPDVCNPAVWKGKNGKYYMMWRKFGQDTYHGIASSPDGVNWTHISDTVLKCTGDMNVIIDPFGDGLIYVTSGGGKTPWYASDGSNDYTDWKNTGKALGDIFGNSRIQEIVDMKGQKVTNPVRFEGVDYRFVGFTENWVSAPRPHTVVLLSNTLTNWVLANPDPVLTPRADFWGEKGSAIGSAMVLPDGNILLASCSCTFAGYTGAPEPSNVSVIVDGRQPWKILKLGILPDAPVSRENVWYQGPNFGTAFYYEPATDTLLFYGGFHDYSIGMMRVQNFSRSTLFTRPDRRNSVADNLSGNR